MHRQPPKPQASGFLKQIRPGRNHQHRNLRPFPHSLAPNWGKTIDRAYQADVHNGANLMTITGGHQIDALCYCLGEFRELSAFAISQRDHIPLESTGESVPLTAPDQLTVTGIVGDGALVSFQIRGGMARATEFLFEIHGEEGDLVLASTIG